MAKIFSAGRVKVMFAFILLFGPALILIFLGTRSCEHKFIELDDYGAAPHYEFTDLNGKKVSSDDFKDKVVLINMLQIGCPDSCAVSFWHIDQLIYQKIRKNKNEVGDVRIISVVTDWEGNEVDDLSTMVDMMKDQVESYDPEIWMIVKGDVKSLYENNYKDGYDLLAAGEELTGGETFVERMLLLDRDNHLRMVRSGKIEKYVRDMYGHIALLLKQYDKAAARKN